MIMIIVKNFIKKIKVVLKLNKQQNNSLRILTNKRRMNFHQDHEYATYHKGEDLTIFGR